jgi:hypothetical protein
LGLFFQLRLDISVAAPLHLLRILLSMGSTFVFLGVQQQDPRCRFLSKGIWVLALAQIAPLPWLSLGFPAAGALAVMGAFPAAALAGACKAELTFPNYAAGGIFHGAAQLLRHRDLGKIGNAVAGRADEVGMGLCVAVEALDATHGAQALDDALLLKQGQVPINRGKGDVRVLRLKHFVQGFRRGVSMGASQTGENGVPLAELLAFLFHKLLLFANGYCLHPYSSTSFPVCQ